MASSSLIMNDEVADVILKLHHGGFSWRFAAHSQILMTRSPKFKEMIEEREEEEPPIHLTIIGIHPDVFLVLLRYLYTNEFPTKITSDILVAAERYRLPRLKEHIEDNLLPDIAVPDACRLLEDLEQQQPLVSDSVVKEVCVSVISSHAYQVFGTDLVFGLSRQTLRKLLESHELNVPDEAILFWGIWRWGRRHCSQNNMPLENEIVAGDIGDLLRLIRLSSLKNRENIPNVARKSMNRCLCARCPYCPPEDSLKKSSLVQTCISWDGLTDALTNEKGNLCIQASFDQDVMLVGLHLEICASKLSDAYIRLFRESDGKELLRQPIMCFDSSVRKLSRTADLENWLQKPLLLSEPLLLHKSVIYSLYLRVCGGLPLLPRFQLGPDRQLRVGSGFLTVHGQFVDGIKGFYLVTDVEATWGPT